MPERTCIFCGRRITYDHTEGQWDDGDSTLPLYCAALESPAPDGRHQPVDIPPALDRLTVEEWLDA